MVAPLDVRPLPEAPPTEPLDAPTSDAGPFRPGSAVPPPPATASTAPPGRPKRRRGVAAAGLASLVLVSSAAGGFVGHRLAESEGSTPAAATAAPLVRDASTGAAATTLDVQAVLAAVEGAVVDIQATGPRQSGQGTGIVYSADGLVLTNAHVVEGATQVTVTTAGDRQARAATVVGADTTHDVAVLRLADTSGLVVAQLGDSGAVKVGQDVIAIGNALGLRGDPSVTRGIVSALDRSIGDLTGLLQTDAAINSGNSGGPLVDAAGQVIGINTAIAVENNAQNIGFAIPIDDAKGIADGLVKGTPTTAPGYLGVATTDNDAATTGATVAEVTAGSAAAAAGLRPGDVVVAVDGSAVSGAASLSRLVGLHHAGDKVELTIVRSGKEQKVTATLGSK